MRTTVTIDDGLMEKALRFVPPTIKRRSPQTYVINEGLKAFISQEAATRLAEMGGNMPDLDAAPRNRR